MSYPPPTQGPGGIPMEKYPPSECPQPEDYPLPTAPITHQPESEKSYPPAGCMPPPAIPVSCPPGLEYLIMIDKLIVHQVFQQLDILEALMLNFPQSEYAIKNGMGQTIYSVKENTPCCARNSLGRCRPFNFRIRDNNGTEVIYFDRGCRCDGCCCPCSMQRLEVGAASGNILGAVQQEWTFLVPKYQIENESGETVLRIVGPICKASCCGPDDVEFQVMSTNNEISIGKITRRCAGLSRGSLTEMDHFEISFPIDLDVKLKAVLLGALFLIDFMFFPKTKRDDDPELC